MYDVAILQGATILRDTLISKTIKSNQTN